MTMRSMPHFEGEDHGPTERDDDVVVGNGPVEEVLEPTTGRDATDEVGSAKVDERRAPSRTGKRPVSERKRAANALNGRKGGPKTPEGKRRSSRNAIKTGANAGPYAITAGPFREDPEDLERFFNDVIADLKPKTVLEFEAARLLALEALGHRRVERYVAAALSELTASQPNTAQRLAPSLAALQADRDPELLSWLVDRGAPPHADWFDTAVDLQELDLVTRNDVEAAVPGLWDGKITPTTQDQWRAAAEQLKTYIIAHKPEAITALKLRIAESHPDVIRSEEAVLAQAVAQAVQRLFEEGRLDKLSAIQDRKSGSLRKALKTYKELR
jgi:hypothetical protein